MMSAEDLIKLQNQQNAVQDAERVANELRNITLARFWQDIGGALDGCMHDLLNRRDKSLAEAFASPSRLLGFGFLLIALGFGGLLACLVLGLRTA